MGLKQTEIETSEGKITVNQLPFMTFAELQEEGKDKNITEMLKVAIPEDQHEKLYKLDLEEGSKVMKAYLEVNGMAKLEIKDAEDIKKKDE